MIFSRFKMNSDYINLRDTHRHLETIKISKQTRIVFFSVFIIKIIIMLRCSLLPAVGHNGNKKEIDGCSLTVSLCVVEMYSVQ